MGSRIKKRSQKKPTIYFFDSLKHFKNNLSNLIAIELPTLNSLGTEEYCKLLSVNYKSKYPDMKKFGFIDYHKPSDNQYELTEEAEMMYQGKIENFYLYSKNDIDSSKTGKNIASIAPEDLNKRLEELKFDLEKYKEILLELLFLYFDSADSIRPYLALITYAHELNITNLTREVLLDILSQTKENILLGKFEEGAFNKLDPELQEEVKRPISYIKNFLETSFIIDSNSKIIIDKNKLRSIQLKMERVVVEQVGKNYRSTREQAHFRRVVLEAYQYRCAITKKSIAISDNYLLEAAHIIPYRDGGSFSVTNGIALSYEMHKMFDRGLFGFQYNEKGKLCIRVSDSKKIKDDGKILEQLADQEVILPDNKDQWPDSFAVQVNLKKYLLQS